MRVIAVVLVSVAGCGYVQLEPLLRPLPAGQADRLWYVAAIRGENELECS